VSHFAYYAIMGAAVTGVADAYAYPVPWRTGDNSDKITFGKSLPQPCVITVYTISGQKVRGMDVSDPTYDWDVKTEGGSPVASGVYIYVVEGAGGTKTGKLIIIR